MANFNNVPRNPDARVAHVLETAQSGDLQAAVLGRGVRAYNPYYFNYYTNRDVSNVRHILNYALPTLRAHEAQYTPLPNYKLMKELANTYEERSPFVGTGLYRLMEVASTLKLVNVIEDEQTHATSYTLTKNGLEAEPVWLYDPKHAVGCLGGIAIGAASLATAAETGAHALNILDPLIVFGTFATLGTTASKAMSAMRVARKAHRAYLELQKEI